MYSLLCLYKSFVHCKTHNSYSASTKEFDRQHCQKCVIGIKGVPKFPKFGITAFSMKKDVKHQPTIQVAVAMFTRDKVQAFIPQ